MSQGLDSSKGLGQSKNRLLLFSLVSTFTSLIPTLWAAWIANSVTLWTDFLRCAAEFLSIFLSWLVVLRSGRPVSVTHNYGYGKLEQLAGLVVAMAMLVTFVISLFAAYERLKIPVIVSGSGFGIIFAALSVIGNVYLWIVNRSQYRIDPSPVLDSQARLFRAKTAATLIVLVSLSISSIFQDLSWVKIVDPIGAILLSLFLLHSAYAITTSSVNELIDCAVDESIQMALIKILVKHEQYYHGIKGFKTRRSGRQLFIQLLLEFEATTTMDVVQKFADIIKKEVNLEIPFSEVEIVPSVVGS